MKRRSQRGWRVRELMANQRCFEKKGNFIFLLSKYLSSQHRNVGKCHLKMNSSDGHFLLVLKDSVISVQISQLIRDFNFQLCTFILKMLYVTLSRKFNVYFLTSVCLLPLNFLLILSMLSIREQILLRTFLKSFMWFLSR